MKKQFSILMFLLLVLFLSQHTVSLTAQTTPITVPDYAYGDVYSEYGTVTQLGVANPGPYGGYINAEDQRQNGIFFAKGYRWWGYPSYPLLICGQLPEFDFPGKHGYADMTSLGCGNPPIGHMASWGGVIAEPASRTIWCITGSKNHNGPTAQYCVEVPWLPAGEICYSPPSTWGYGSSYGYLRKAFVVQSTGLLQKGDPVDLRASLTARISQEGEGTASGMGVLFLHRISETPWYQGRFGREYLTWGTIQDFFGSPTAIARVVIEQTGIADSVMNAAIGDTIIVEVGFNNTIKHNNPGSSAPAAEGWAGEKPSRMFANPVYARTDTIRNLIKEYGNQLTYDLICLTQGALLTPLTPGGPNVDEDKDGISDAREKGPDGSNSNFDGNADGVSDYQQANAASFHTYGGDNYATLVVPPDNELSQVIVTGNPSPANTPADAEFPWGFFDFSIDGLDPGEAVTVTLILHSGEPAGKYYKYGLTPDNLEPHWYDFTYDGQTGAVINGNTITLHFVDGLRGDEDISVNGSIKEPGGPAKSSSTAIHELNEKEEMVIYPNPVSGNITLQCSNMKPGQDYHLKINGVSNHLP